MSEVSMPPDASNPELRHPDAAGWAWTLNAALSHLPRLSGKQYYECWYLKSASDPPSDAIRAGSLTYGQGGSGTFTMTSAADPKHYKIMEIAIQRPGDNGRPGQVILRGSAQPA
jgi:hypothetical protein